MTTNEKLTGAARLRARRVERNAQTQTGPVSPDTRSVDPKPKRGNGVPNPADGDDHGHEADPKPKADNRLPHHEGCNCARCRSEKSIQAEGKAAGDEFVTTIEQFTKAVASVDTTERPKAKRERKTGSVRNPPSPKLPVAQGIPIFDPAKPGIIFDGKVKVLSTCRDCHELMQVVYPSEYVHPCCTPQPSVMESLTTGWLTCIEAGDEESAKLTEQEMAERDARPPNLPMAAIAYARWGWPVFPLQPGTKEPATKNGFLDATTKVSWVKKWWERNPQYNIGLRTGINFDVFDVDPDHGGIPSFMEVIHKTPDAHGVVVTASGGIHLYLKATGKGNRSGWLPGLDYRGKGGYVVAPPSTLGERHRSWSWLCVPSPEIKGGA